jgi:alpha/beta superfamily hydrolase
VSTPDARLDPAAITPGDPEVDGPYAAVERVVEFLNEGERVVGTLALPQGEGAAPPYAVVLIFPGLTNTRDSLPITGTDENLYGRAARLLAENGIASLRLDFRGSGDSDGAWSDMTFSSQIADALAAIDYLATVPEVDVTRLGLIGLSQGGLVAAETAARDERVDSVILWSPVSNPPDTYKLLMGADTVAKGLTAPDPGVEVQLPWGDPFLMKSGFFRDLYAINPVGAIAEVEAPLLVVVGLQDTTVTPQPFQGEAYLNYHEGPEMLVQVNSDHVLSVISPAGPTILDDVVGWTLAWLEASL